MTGLCLTDGQIRKIINAANKQTSVTIRLSKQNLDGSHKLPLTESQINRIDKARKASTGLNLKLAYAQIKHVKKMISQLKKTGGILPLLTLIPLIASALGAAGGVASGVASAVSAVNNSKAATLAQAETERHNREIEKQLKSGDGMFSEYAGKTPVIGHFLKPLLQKLGLGVSDYSKIVNGGCVKCGKGLYLKPFGAGLYLGPE